MKKLVISVLLLYPLLTFSQQNSVLSAGDWYKLSVEQTGVHKITYDDLISYGIDVYNLDPRHIIIYGNPAGMLSESLDDEFYTDLQSMAIEVIGEEDGIFDPDDYVLFYAQGPDTWQYDEFYGLFRQSKNIYARKTNYFLTISNHDVKRIQAEQSTTLDPTFTPSFYNTMLRNEMEYVNPGSTGKSWLGEDFLQVYSRSFNILNTNLVDTESHHIRFVLASHSFESNNFEIKIDGEAYKTLPMPISLNNSYEFYRERLFDSAYVVSGESNEITFIYNREYDTANAWINYFELNLKMHKSMVGDQLSFRSALGVGVSEITQFSLDYDTPENIRVWNVTDPLNVKNEVLLIESGSVNFRLATESILEFHAFNGDLYYSPEFVTQIENQNLHNINAPDLLIITHPDFSTVANQIADLHRNEDGLMVETVNVFDIYNEFSSGSQDIGALRNFVRYLRQQSETNSKPNYLLLMGDASFDYLDKTENNTNFVPTFQTIQSNNSISSFASDQFFGLVDMTMGGEMKVAVGRIPVTTTDEANQVFSKIETYYSNNALGKWTNEMMFIADDGDSNHHSGDAELLTDHVDTTSPVFNINKAYLDFFQLVETNDGPRYPEVNALITNKTNEGVFYINYTGHGGNEQLANEKILSKEDLGSWTNNSNMPLWVIASGNVARYDNPEYVSLGEAMFMNEDGAIALIATAGLTFASSNLAINSAIIQKLTDINLEGNLRLGDLMKSPFPGNNLLKWTLLGDPALKLHFPKFKVKTTALNGIDIEDYSDTIPPGASLVINGIITTKDEDEIPVVFNGNVYLKVFAPKYLRSTLANQGGSYVEEIEVQDSILVTGTSIIENGAFEIQVFMPAQYWETYGNLKFSWYAEDGEDDANGYYNQLSYGGEPDAIPESDKFFDQVKVYPTVFRDYLNIEMPLIAEKNIIYRVYNSMGVEVYSLKSESVSGNERIQIPGLTSGMYILNMNIDNISRNFKVFKN